MIGGTIMFVILLILMALLIRSVFNIDSIGKRKDVVLYRRTNQGLFRVIERKYFERTYYEVQRKVLFWWSTMNDGSFPESPSTYKWKSLNDVEGFFKTGKIMWPGTSIP